MFFATKGSAPIVYVFADRLNEHVFTPVLRWPETGLGAKRAAERLARKRRANQAIPDTGEISRQQMRRMALLKRKRRALTPAGAARLRLSEGEQA